MRRQTRFIILSIQLLVLMSIFLIPTGLERKLFAASGVIQKFEAGPEKVPKKRVGRVKTNFVWNQPGQPCKCTDDRGPCIETFMDKEISQKKTRYPSMIEDYFIQNRMGSEYQGAGQVPWGIDVASVRLINIPFCGQVRRGKANPSTK